MLPPESEWMLWAMRLKTWVRAELDQPNQAVQSLDTRCAKLEEATAMLDALNGDVKRLIASNEHLQHTNSALQDRILEVESESITRDRKSATGADVLREASRLLSQQLKDVVEDFNQIKTELKATEEKQRRERQEQKQQIVDLRSSIDVSSKRKAGPLDLIAIPGTKGIFADSWQRMKRSQKPRRLVILQLKPGKETYQEYLASGETFVREILQQSEAQAVKAYVKGMKQKFRRQAVWTALETKGWTWAKARHEIQMIIDEGKKRRQGRRTMQLPSLGKID
ncbi:MAG: hypothetical protein L6R42_000943 [Xanthoria sp. 1 TBL-2021]|nr:MAG: hypothetical protein L6R42_000943 [Xanthoria sp. 1 TBL-2021]